MAHCLSSIVRHHPLVAMATKKFFYKSLKKSSCKKTKELELRYSV
jgi:hypothetical protein